MGHDLKLDDAYDRPSFDFIVSEYGKAVDASHNKSREQTKAEGREVRS